jgi:hypothetical protein
MKMGVRKFFVKATLLEGSLIAASLSAMTMSQLFSAICSGVSSTGLGMVVVVGGVVVEAVVMDRACKRVAAGVAFT